MGYKIGDAEEAGWSFTAEDSPTEEIIFRRRHVMFRAWKSTMTGRWFWHRKAGGNITDDGSYASRGSARRAILQRIAKED